MYDDMLGLLLLTDWLDDEFNWIVFSVWLEVDGGCGITGIPVDHMFK